MVLLPDIGHAKVVMTNTQLTVQGPQWEGNAKLVLEA